MRGYNWYEELSYSDELSQGDLIYDCPIPVPSSGVYQELRQVEGDSGQTAELEEPVDIQHANIVIMTQSCDIEQNKVDSLIVCPIWTLAELHRLYALPKEYLQSVASGTDLRLRLLPPYREHLSQAFARYFMRVGLPIDIPKERVKDYQ